MYGRRIRVVGSQKLLWLSFFLPSSFRVFHVGLWVQVFVCVCDLWLYIYNWYYRCFYIIMYGYIVCISCSHHIVIVYFLRCNFSIMFFSIILSFCVCCGCISLHLPTYASHDVCVCVCASCTCICIYVYIFGSVYLTT